MRDIVISVPSNGELKLIDCLKVAYNSLRSSEVRSVTEPFTKVRYFNTFHDRIRLARRIKLMQEQLNELAIS